MGLRSRQSMPKRRQPKPPPEGRALAERLMAKHRDQGIPDVIKPFKDASGIPEIPEDITELEDKDLSKLYGQLDGFASYVGTRLAVAEVNKLDIGRQLEDRKAEFELRELDGVKKGEVTRKRLEVFMLGELVELRVQETYHSAEVKLLKSRYEGIERTIRVLSREQSRRESKNGRRSYNQP